MNIRKLVPAFWAWMDCVAATAGGALGSIRSPRCVRLTEEEQDRFRVDYPAGKDAPGVVDHIRIADGRLLRSIPSHLATALRGSQIELSLQPGRFLFRPLDLPKRAGEFLDGIVQSQIDRLTPWSAADAAFGWTQPVETGNDRITVTVAATARTYLAAYIEVFSALGARSIAVSTLPPISAADPVPIEVLQQEGGVLDVAGARRSLMWILAAAALSMSLATIADQVVGPAFEAQRDVVFRRLADARHAMHEAGTAGAPLVELALERRKRETPSAVIVLEALSRILPDHTFATELRIDGDKLQIIGITHDAPSLIRLIEQSQQFTRATFFAPTTRSPSDPGERFHIEARIKAGFAVQK
jgi:general secretion pathway protein L